MTNTGVSLAIQTPANNGSRMLDRLVPLFEDQSIIRAQMAVAYVTWQGLGHLKPSLEKFLTRGSRLETVYGAANGVTTPDALLYSAFLFDAHSSYKFAGVVEDPYSNSAFHPKLFAFHRKHELELLVGSANLTRGGLFMNTEAVLHVRAPKGSSLFDEFSENWKYASDGSAPLSADKVRSLVKQHKLVPEMEAEKAPSGKPALTGKFPPFLPPVFQSVLKSPTPQKKKHLTQLDAASDKPEKLYLQVFDYETGGHGSAAGYQVQLPVGCLTAYFGVGPNEARDVIVEMMGATLSVSLTHFANNTHRIRLKPLLDIVRPAIIVFERAGEDHYVCTPVPAKDYTKTLALKCTEQQREGARRWGIE